MPKELLEVIKMNGDSYGTILGLLIISFVMFCALGLSALIFFLQMKNRRALEGKALATIAMTSGERVDQLLKIEGDHLVIPGEDKMKGFDKTPMIRPDKAFKTWWPFGRPRILQIHINSFFYSEGNPEPWDPFDRPIIINDEVLGNLQNVNFSRAMVGRSEEIVATQQLPRKPKHSLIFWLIMGSCVLGIVAIIYFIFSAGGA